MKEAALARHLKSKETLEVLRECPQLSISAVARVLGHSDGYVRSLAGRSGLGARARRALRDKAVLEHLDSRPGQTYQEAADELGISRWSLLSTCRRHGRWQKVMMGSPPDRAILEDIMAGGLVYREIAAKHGVTKHQVKGVALRHGMPARTGFEIAAHHRGRGVTPEQEERAVALLKDPRMTYSQIAREVGLPNTGSIGNISRRHGLLRGRGKLPPGWTSPNKGKPSPRRGIPLGPRRRAA